MNWIDRQNLEAELAAAEENVRLLNQQASELEPHYAHMYLIRAELWDMYAEQLQERLDKE